MTRDEIITSYRNAANRDTQVKVLAELNICPKKVIISILTDAGVYEVPKPSTRPKKRKPPIDPSDIPKIDCRGHRQRTNEEKTAMFKPLYDKGLSDTEIADLCHVAKTTVWKWRDINHFPANKHQGNQGGKRVKKVKG